MHESKDGPSANQKDRVCADVFEKLWGLPLEQAEVVQARRAVLFEAGEALAGSIETQTEPERKRFAEAAAVVLLRAHRKLTAQTEAWRRQSVRYALRDCAGAGAGVRVACLSGRLESLLDVRSSTGFDQTAARPAHEHFVNTMERVLKRISWFQDSIYL